MMMMMVVMTTYVIFRITKSKTKGCSDKGEHDTGTNVADRR